MHSRVARWYKLYIATFSYKVKKVNFRVFIDTIFLSLGDSEAETGLDSLIL